MWWFIALGAHVCLLLQLQTARGESLPAGGDLCLQTGGRLPVEAVNLPPQSLRVVSPAGAPCEDVFEVDVTQQGDQPWSFLLAAVMQQPIAEGDLIHVRFWAKNVRSMTGSTRLAAIVEQRENPHAKLMDLPVTVGSDWQCVDIPFIANHAYSAGEWQFNLRLGYAPQTFQLAGVEIRNYHRTLKIDQLPRMRLSYDGREPDAPWRRAALARIDKMRKGDLLFTVKDPAGHPIANTNIHAALKRHAFGFGSCVSMTLLDSASDAQSYRKTLQDLFSCVVIENELKWPSLMEHGFSRTDPMIQWLREHDFPIRGHCLIWPSIRYIPKEALALKDKPDELRKLIADHVTQTVSRYKGQLVDWDVINEPFANHDVMDWLGNDAMVEWFKLAHAADPEAHLYVNDYEILASGDMLNTSHQQHYYDTIKYLKDHGAPLYGIGMQGHFGSNITSPENLLKILDRFAALGVRIKVTEMDLNLMDEELRADYFRDFMIAMFSHPAVDAVMQWGFWEGSHWIPQSALFNKDWTLRPHGKVFVDLMTRQWKTDVTTQTDSNGQCVIRGFLGEYNIEVQSNGKTIHTTTTIKPGNNTIAVEVK